MKNDRKSLKKYEDLWEWQEITKEMMEEKPIGDAIVESELKGMVFVAIRSKEIYESNVRWNKMAVDSGEVMISDKQYHESVARNAKHAQRREMRLRNIMADPSLRKMYLKERKKNG